MRRHGFALVLAVSSLQAQYFDFAVTDDGRLYLSTPLTTGAENNRSKVYRLTSAGPELVAAGTKDDNPFGDTVAMPLVSGDGSIAGWGMTLPCGSPSCGLSGLPRTFFSLPNAGIDRMEADTLQISRNGRFLLGTRIGGSVRLIELPSQQTTLLPLSLAGPQTVADTGAVLLRSTDSLHFRPFGGEARPVADSAGLLSAALSPGGDRLAFERLRDGRVELVLDGAMLDSAPGAVARFQPRFANDGTLLYLDADSQPVIAAPGRAPRRLVTLDSPGQRAIVSGDGRIAWVATAVGQLLRIHTIDGTMDEVIPATPYLDGRATWAYPGSVVRFTGNGITRAVRFQVGDSRLPLSAVADDFAYVQIPWEYPAGVPARPLTVQAPGSPFFQRFDFTALDRPRITFEREGVLLKAAHQDFRGLVRESDPARPGETIHIFASNMGPVDAPVATGEPSPNPPARVTTPMACYLVEFAADYTPVRSVGLVVPFAGLSPGLVGVYHIDVTIPADWSAKRSVLSCQMDVGDPLYHGDSASIDILLQNQP